MKVFYIYLLVLTTIWVKLAAQEDSAEVDYVSLLTPAETATCEELCDRFNLIPYAEGGGAMDVIRLLTLGFQTAKTYTIPEAREIAVDAIEIFLENINQSRSARPFLAEYPFGPARIELTFLVPDNIVKGINSLSAFEIRNGKVDYFVTNPRTERHEIVLEEPYEKAREEVLKKRGLKRWEHQKVLNIKQEKRKKSFVEKFFSKLFSPSLHEEKYSERKYSGPPEERAMEWSLDAYCKKLGKKHDLQFFRVGDFSNSKVVHYYGFSFIGHQKVSLEKGRILALEISDELFSHICSSQEVKKFRPVINREWADFYNLKLPDEPTIGEVCFKIAFWDENNDRIVPPAIAQIIFIDGKFHYYRADPETGGVVEVFQESFDDAKAFRQQSLKEEGKKS